MASAQPTIAIVGGGLVGARVAQHVMSQNIPVIAVSRDRIVEAYGADVVVLAHRNPHAALASTLMGQGSSVVSVGGGLDDTMDMLALHERAVAAGHSVIVGAACSPGASGLLLHYMLDMFDTVDEVHLAVHGTGGPQCARAHHDGLAGVAVGWHDGEWFKRPGGSGRELCWFPDPVNARDCYRFETPEPVLMLRVEPSLRRISARTSATRRDRLTARLPMLLPPHAEGGIGALRVEVRGTKDGIRHVEICGMAERIASIAASVAAHTALAILKSPVAPGVHVLGESSLPNAEILNALVAGGLTLHQFVGS